MIRRVRGSDEIASNGKFIFVSEALVDQPVQTVELESGDHVVTTLDAGLIDRYGLPSFAAPREGPCEPGEQTA